LEKVVIRRKRHADPGEERRDVTLGPDFRRGALDKVESKPWAA
jgi:hypothetical protein